MPVPLVVNDPTLHVLLPKRSPAVSAQAIESERVQFKSRREAEALLHIRFGFIGRADHKEPVHPDDPVPLSSADRALHLREGLLFLQPVQDSLRACFHAERQEIAASLLQNRELVHTHRIRPAFTAPIELQLAVNDALANAADPLAVD